MLLGYIDRAFARGFRVGYSHHWRNIGYSNGRRAKRLSRVILRR